MMTDQVWVEMPTVGTEAPDDPVRPKYPLQGKVFLIHQTDKAYVIFQDDRAREEALQQADCRRLTSREAHVFEENLPFPIPLLFLPDNYNNRPVRLGDVVSRLTRRAGIAECSACKRRKRWLNQIVIWGWWRR